MLREKIHHFLDDERGSYTLWSLVWFLLYVGIGGIAVDGTDAYNKQTLLQATADAAALAGVMSLPDESDAVDMAMAYAEDNLETGPHGVVLKENDVNIGYWDFDSESLYMGGASDPNAVHAITRRTRDNGNPVIMSFLRILQLWGFEPAWDVVTEAVAVKYLPECLLGNGLIAGNKVDMTSNNALEDICIHGENLIDDPGHNYAIEIQNNGLIGDGVQLSVPTIDEFTGLPTRCSNEGLCTADGELDRNKVLEGHRDVNDAALITDALNTLMEQQDSFYVPDYLYTQTVDGPQLTFNLIDLDNCEQCTESVDPETGEIEYTYTGTLPEGQISLVKCANQMERFNLPDSSIQPDLVNVGVVSQCRIGGGQGVNITDSMIASLATGNGKKPFDLHAIKLTNIGRLGSELACEDGGARIYSASSVKFTANVSIYSTQILAAGDVEFTANGDVAGISVQAGEDIKMTANNTFSYCPPDPDWLDISWRYKLVR